MNYLQIMSIIFVCSGVLVVVLALFFRAKENSLNNQARDDRLDYFEYDKILRDIASSVSEMDKTMEDFQKTASFAFQEIDEKYRELQFLYTLVDEKKKEVSDLITKQQVEPIARALAPEPRPVQGKKSVTPIAAISIKQDIAEKGFNANFSASDNMRTHAMGLAAAPHMSEAELIDIPKSPYLGYPTNETAQENLAAVTTAPNRRAMAEKASHPRRDDILDLSGQGLTVSEIAERLNIGQDMVKLILQLGKAR